MHTVSLSSGQGTFISKPHLKPKRYSEWKSGRTALSRLKTKRFSFCFCVIESLYICGAEKASGGSRFVVHCHVFSLVLGDWDGITWKGVLIKRIEPTWGGCGAHVNVCTAAVSVQQDGYYTETLTQVSLVNHTKWVPIFGFIFRKVSAECMLRLVCSELWCVPHPIICSASK